MQWIKIFNTRAEAEAHLANHNPLVLVIHKLRYCFYRYNDTYFATAESCPHLGEALSGGVINPGGEIVCPLHHYRFNIQNGRECMERTKDLATFPVRHDERGIFIGIK